MTRSTNGTWVRAQTLVMNTISRYHTQTTPQFSLIRTSSNLEPLNPLQPRIRLLLSQVLLGSQLRLRPQQHPMQLVCPPSLQLRQLRWLVLRLLGFLLFRLKQLALKRDREIMQNLDCPRHSVYACRLIREFDRGLVGYVADPQ